MKKCPYCAEEIQDEAIFCRYCMHDLKEVSKGQGVVVAASGLREPPVWESLFFALIFIVFTDILLVGIAMAFSMATGIVTDENLQLFGIAVGLLVRVVVGVVSVKGFRPTSATAINYIGMILLAFIPIGSWVPTYYAGKAIAYRVPPKVTIILIAIIVGICLLVGIPLISNNSISKSYTTIIAPTSIVPNIPIIVNPTNVPTVTKRSPTPTTDPLSGCLHWPDVPWTYDLSFPSDENYYCVYGTIVSTYYLDTGEYVLRFSQEPDTPRIYLGGVYSFSLSLKKGIKPPALPKTVIGKCVVVKGYVMRAGPALAIIPDKNIELCP